MADLDLATILADGQYLKRAGDTLVGDVPAVGGGGETDIPAGGTIGQVLAKDTNTDYDVSWQDVVAEGWGGQILDGPGQPDPVLGLVGDYFEDTAAGILYGPKGSTPWGAQQRPTVASAPDSTTTVQEAGCRYRFARAGRVASCRYQRSAAAAGTLTIQAWKDSTTSKVAEIADTRGAVAGTFTVTFPTPVWVAAGETWTFTYAVTTGEPPRNNAPQLVTNTADVMFVENRLHATFNQYPNTVDTTRAFYVEPVFEANEAWPVTVRSVTGYASTVRTVVPKAGTPLTGVITDAGCYLRFTGTNPTYTVPPNSAVAFPVGTQIDGIGSATAMTLTQGAGVTINRARTLVTLGAKSGWTLVKVATDEWDLHGDMV